MQVLDLPGRRRINVQLFSVVAAMSEKVVQLQYVDSIDFTHNVIIPLMELSRQQSKISTNTRTLTKPLYTLFLLAARWSGSW